MTENTCGIRVKERERRGEQISQRTIKANIRGGMNNNDISLLDLSKDAHMNVFILMYLLYCPVSKVRLSNSFKICKALDLQVSKLFE